jgi:hypothetical protein
MQHAAPSSAQNSAQVGSSPPTLSMSAVPARTCFMQSTASAPPTHLKLTPSPFALATAAEQSAARLTGKVQKLYVLLPCAWHRGARAHELAACI